MDENTPSTAKQPNGLLFVVRPVWHMVVAVIGAYGLSLTLFYLLRWTVGEQLTVVAVINSFLHLMLLPSLGLFPLALMVRRWSLVGVLILPFVVVVADVGVPLTRRPLDPPPNSVLLSVMTYNLYEANLTLDEAAALIRTADADIVALQELTHGAAAHLSDALADVYPHAALYPQDIGTHGQGLLSRYAIAESRFFQTDARIVLGHQRAVVDVDGHAVTVYNVHPPHPFIGGIDVSIRTDDLMPVYRMAADERDGGAAVLLMGDFNMPPKTADYQRVTRTFTDSYGVVGRGLGYTFPHFRGGNWLYRYTPPLARIDYVFVSDQFQPLSARVWPTSGGSDHRPLYVEMALLAD